MDGLLATANSALVRWKENSFERFLPIVLKVFYRDLAVRRELGGGDIRFRIHETLPVKEVHAIMSGITRQVLSETGPLEAAE